MTQARARNTLAVASAFALLVGVGLAQNALRVVTSGATALVPLPPKFVGLSLDPRIIKRLLGVRLLVADLLWIDTLVKADIAHEPQPFTDFYRAFKTIVALDPDNVYAYYVSGLYLSVIKDDVRGATAILREGAQYLERNRTLPQARNQGWKIQFTLGYNLMFEEHEIEEGTHWVQRAGQWENAPKYVKDLAILVATERGRLEVGARVLGEVHRTTARPEEREIVEAKMLEIASKQELLDLNEGFERYLRTTEAYALPRKKAFTLYMKTIGRPTKDLRGRPIGIDSAGQISVLSNR